MKELIDETIMKIVSSYTMNDEEWKVGQPFPLHLSPKCLIWHNSVSSNDIMLPFSNTASLLGTFMPHVT